MNDNLKEPQSTESIQQWVIFTLDFLYMFLFGACIFNLQSLWKSKRLSKNKMLLTFYVFGTVTLACRVGIFTTEIVYIMEND